MFAQPNILHLLVLAGTAGAVMLFAKEARGRSLPPGRLFLAPLLTLAAAVLLLAMPGPEARDPSLWLVGLTTGAILGTARGAFARLLVDRLYDRLRLPRGRDGLWAALLLGAIVVAAFSAELLPGGMPVEVAAVTAAAACAGYLAGRAGSLWLRALSAPHHCLHRS